MHFLHSHLYAMEEEGGEKTLEAEEGFLLEVDTVEFLQILVVEVKIKILVFDKSNIQFHYYKKYGHYAYECRKR